VPAVLKSQVAVPWLFNLAVVDDETHDIFGIETVTGRAVRRLLHRTVGFPFPNELWQFAFFPDGHGLAASVALGHQTVVWDFARGSVRTNPSPGAGDYILTLAVSPDDKLVATGDRSNAIELRDAGTLALRAQLLGHSQDVVSLAFAPDCRRLASGDVSGAVKLWDLTMGEELVELEGITGGAHYLRFAPDGLILVGGSLDNGGRFVVWNGHPPGSKLSDQAR
jgi:WD40 repeat protein